jgi:hypothetical protein
MNRPAGKTATTKRCHWVPQGYLRAFAADLPARSKIWRLSKEHGVKGPELKPIKKVAVKHHLYVPLDSATGKRDDSFERKLSELECWFGDPVWRALGTEMMDLSWEPLRKMVALLVAVMQFRNPSHFDIYKDMHRQFVELFSGECGVPSAIEVDDKLHEIDISSWPAYRDATEDALKRGWIDQISTVAWYAKKLMAMRWSVVCADQPTFITSDNPVTIIHPSLQFKGIGNPETTIMFPLSPTRLLNMDNRHGEPGNQYYALNDDGSSANLLIWRHANEFMFSHRHTGEVCADLIADAERYGFA